MATVNKNTLAGRLAEKTNLSQKDAGRVLNALFGGKLDGSWSGADELSFMDVNGVRPGAYGSLSLEAKNLGSLYTRVETGGFRNEPTLTVGLRFGGGSKPRLSPFR